MIASGIITTLRWARHATPDVLHAHWVLPNGFIGAVVSRLTGIPLVVSVPGSDAQLARANALFGAMARFAFRQAGLITANSADLRDAVVGVGADPAKFDMIVYGTDPDRLRPDRTGVDELRHSLGVRADESWCSPSGGWCRRRASTCSCAQWRSRRSGRDRSSRCSSEKATKWPTWQALGRSLGIENRVRWVGSVASDRIGVYYNAADILAMPAVTDPADGLNVCVLDAMSCGKPVVGSNVAGNPLAIADGVTGTIVPERSPAVLATALAALADDPDLRRRMGDAGRRRIDEELGWAPLTGGTSLISNRWRASAEAGHEIF